MADKTMSETPAGPSDLLLFIHFPHFASEWKRLGLSDDDLARLEWALVGAPQAGKAVAGTGGLRKLRFAPPGRGKSGAYRVGYAHFPAHGAVALIAVYAKADQGDLTPRERAAVKGQLDWLGRWMDAGGLVLARQTKR